MTVSNAIKKLTKHGEVKHNGRQFWVVIGSEMVGFIANGDPNDPETTITCEGVKGVNDHSEPQSDYCAWTYFSNLTQALNCALRIRDREAGHA